MSDASTYYKHSGVFSIPGFFLLLALSLPLAVMMGIAYGLAVFYVPLVKISFIITGAAGGGLGYLLGKLGVFGKVRSMMALIVIALVAGVVTWYCSWLVWIFAYMDYEAYTFAPEAVYSFMQIGFYEGLWSMGSDESAFSGYPLVGVWLIEAAMIIGIAVLVPYNMLSDKLFCETCGSWLTGLTKFPQREPIADPAAMVSALEAADFEPLAAMGPRHSIDDPYTKVVLHSCETCQDIGYLDVSACVLVESKDEAVSTQETKIVRHLVVPVALGNALSARWADDAMSVVDSEEQSDGDGEPEFTDEMDDGQPLDEQSPA